jgi:3-hydroxyacyl-CoA dehydrogenase
MGASYQARGTIAVITLENPPVNGLSYQLRLEVTAALENAEADPAIVAIVIIGAGKVFSGGADIKEFGLPRSLAEPSLPTIIRRLEDCPKPVVAAVHGVCMGGGLELALAAHYRVAAPGTSVALPEVKLGLLPGAGGTQRLPRVLGVEMALNMILNGEPMKSEALAARPGQKLFDQIIEGELLDGACAFAVERATEHSASGAPLPLIRKLQSTQPAPEEFFQSARNSAQAMSRHLPAPAMCVEAVEASVKRSFDDGVAHERRLFIALLNSPESKALRHAFLAERAAGKIADVPASTQGRRIESAAVIGAGKAGVAISVSLLNAGIPVTLLDDHQEALDRSFATIREIYTSQINRGELEQRDYERRLGLLSQTPRYESVCDADIAIEAMFEDGIAREHVFRNLDKVMKPGAILAASTSDVDAIAAFTRRPHDVIGMQFVARANMTKLVEVARGKETAKDVLATMMTLVKTLRKIAVVTKSSDGFISDRMFGQYLRQANNLLENGCTPQQVDVAMERFGFEMGPFRMAGVAGDDSQKSGVISDDWIVHRIVWALVNEGAKSLHRGLADRASDIDLVCVACNGFPVHLGGPMFYADTVGLRNVSEAMKRFAHDPRADAASWQTAALLERLAADGRTFN